MKEVDCCGKDFTFSTNRRRSRYAPFIGPILVGLSLTRLVRGDVGLLTFFIPGITLLALVLLFGVYALLDGIFDIVSAFRSSTHHWAFVVEGIVGIIDGQRPATNHSEGQ
jgi:hypothetical protein